jgi:hypothetical protein
MAKGYSLIKDDYSNQVISYEAKDISGFKFKPLNKVKYDGITVNEMMIVKPVLIEKILKRKIKRKLEMYLQYIISVLDDEEGGDLSGLRSALNDLSRYKDTVNARYQAYLDEKYVALLLKKIELLEHELKMKIIHYKEPIEKEIEKKEEINHRRR